jgi:prevent-host-death family protein
MQEEPDEESIERVRNKLGEAVDRARYADRPTVITRQGKRAAVIVSTAWYETAKAAIAGFDAWLDSEDGVPAGATPTDDDVKRAYAAGASGIIRTTRARRRA